MSREPGGEPTSAYIQRAELLSDLGRHTEAGEELRHALALEPQNALALALYADVLLADTRFDEALTVAGQALVADPHNVPAHVVRGQALAALERTEEALAAAEDLLKQDPESWYVNVHYARIVRQTRNGQPALDAAWRAVQLAPGEAVAHRTLADVARDLGLVDLAVRAGAEAERLAAGGADAAPAGTTSGLPEYGLAPDPVSPLEPALDGALGRLVRVGACYAIAAPVVVAATVAFGGIADRVVGLLAAIGGLLVVGMPATRLPESTPDERRQLPLRVFRADKWLAAALAAVFAAPVALLAYPLLASPGPLGVAIALGAFALIALVMRWSGTVSSRWFD